jgi:hypothetical protein
MFRADGIVAGGIDGTGGITSTSRGSSKQMPGSSQRCMQGKSEISGDTRRTSDRETWWSGSIMHRASASARTLDWTDR